jgi:TorA maturation chaperone TorD
MLAETLMEPERGYNFFANLFLTLPDAQFIETLLKTEIESCDEGAILLNEYIAASALKDKQELLTEILVDRTQLLRALTADGPRPPYESYYLRRAPQDIMGELNKLYEKAGVGVLEDIHEPPDYIGVELAFMAKLYAFMMEGIKNNDNKKQELISKIAKDFFNNHLSKWVTDFAEETVKFAKTGFYKGLAMMLKSFIEELKDQGGYAAGFD